MNKKYQLTCKEFGLRLAKIRESRSVSARQMSLDIGQRKNYPSMVHFFDICEYLHITPQAFFDTGNEQTFSVSTEDFLHAISHLSPQKYHHLYLLACDLCEEDSE